MSESSKDGSDGAVELGLVSEEDPECSPYLRIINKINN